MFGIGFLNSIFLFALSAILLPAIIHLLNRRKATRVRFSTLRFIEELSKRRMRKVNLRRLLVLILRTLAVLFLVLAFARPTLTAFAGFFNSARSAGEVVICIDNSYSMGVELEKGTAFSEAKTIAKRVINECSTKDRINILVFSDKSEAIFEEGTSNHKLAKQVIDGIPISERGTDLASAIAHALNMVKKSRYPRSEIYVASDFRAVSDSSVVPEDMGSTRLVFLPVYETKVDNVSIDKVYIPRKLIRPGEVIHLEVVVTNHSSESDASFPLEVLVEDKRIAEKQVDLPALSTLTVSFAFTLSKRGTYHCSARKSRDRLIMDDERFFLLDVSKSIPVLVIRGSGAYSQAPSPGTFFYISKALDPRPGKAGEREFVVTIKRENLITVEDLPARGVVMWTDPGLESERAKMLRDYVRTGGSMAIFIGSPSLGILRNKSFLEFIGAGQARKLVREKMTGLAGLRSSHPIFDLFKEEELKLLSRVQVSEKLKVSGVKPDSILAFTEDGYPLMWERTWGKGRMVVFTTTPDIDGGNLPLSPMFLPLMHTTASYLADAVMGAVRDNYVGKRLYFHPSKRLRQIGMNLAIKHGREYVGEPVLFTKPSREIGVFFYAPEEKGFYSLIEDTLVIAESVVNPDSREGNLELSIPRGPSRFGAVIVHSGESFLKELREARSGREIFLIFFILCLVCLATESLIGRKG